MTLGYGIEIKRVVAAHGERALANDAGPECARIAEATGFKTRRLAKEGQTLFDFALPAARQALAGGTSGAKSPPSAPVTAVVAATFSNTERFPSLAVRLASELGLPKSTPALDIHMACSAYPYALYVASCLSRDTRGDVLLVDADIQSRFVDPADRATALVMDDAATATIVRANPDAPPAHFEFISSAGDALVCQAEGPIAMDGFKVFSFVAGDVARALKAFDQAEYDIFLPHRANLYMVRQLARAIGAEAKLLAPEADFANPGSASIPATIAAALGTSSIGHQPTALLAGFGAGLSLAACTVRLCCDRTPRG